MSETFSIVGLLKGCISDTGWWMEVSHRILKIKTLNFKHWIFMHWNNVSDYFPSSELNSIVKVKKCNRLNSDSKFNITIFNVPKFNMSNSAAKFNIRNSELNSGEPKEEQSILDHGQARRATGSYTEFCDPPKSVTSGGAVAQFLHSSLKHRHEVVHVQKNAQA